MINVGICIQHKLLLRGVELILDNCNDFNILFAIDNKKMLVDKVANKNLHVLIISVSDVSNRTLNLFVRLHAIHQKLKILVIPADRTEETIIKIVKSNAKGLLSNNAEPRDLIEAVYSLRNGFDYFDKSIKHIVLQQYVRKINDATPEENLQKLSERQIEIIKLWGSSLTNQEIADKLCISIRTVETHKTHIMQKLQLKTTIDLIKFSIKNNIIQL
ncbi:MAG: response regulator transcription factor [Bacteroidales bacterium]|nr:response regulator transcription factor [Bacteroidales bacterium]NLK81233.1 response regulator transcription factor [Bacteroidales bacterium]HPY82787.1 response regulator transcription factor [Bacteroidales bacterium]